MAGRDNNPNGFGAFKVYAADQLTNHDIAKLSTYFNFPPALRERLHGEGLEFVNTLIDKGFINESDISVLLHALHTLELFGKQDLLKKKFMSCMEVGFGAFKEYVADLLTFDVIASLTSYFNFPPALCARLRGDRLGFVNTLVQRGFIKGTDISKLLHALHQLELSGVKENLQRNFIRYMEFAPQVENVASPNEPSSTPEDGEPSKTSTNVENVASPNEPSSTPEDGEPSKTSTNVENVASPNEPSSTPEDGEPSKTSTNVENVASPNEPSPTPEGGEPSKTSTKDVTKPVFISFSYKDLTKVENFKATFEEALGPQTCWICTTGIKGGQTMDRKIVRALDKAKVVVCMISQDYIDSNECEKEVLVAEQYGKKMIPVHIEDVTYPYKYKDGEKSALQFPFARCLYMKLTGEDMQRKIQDVIVRIEELISHEDNQ